MGCVGTPSNVPLDMTKIWQAQLYFNVLRSLDYSLAGALAGIDGPTSTSRSRSHRAGDVSRLALSRDDERRPDLSAVHDLGLRLRRRSVFQRALYPLKAYIRLMIANDMIATKLGLLVAKTRPPGPIINRVMQVIASVKRALLKQAQTGQVLTVDPDEDITTLNMQNVDGRAHTLATT